MSSSTNRGRADHHQGRVTVAKEIELETASRTWRADGEGGRVPHLRRGRRRHTTATVLAQAIFVEGEADRGRRGPMDVKRGIDAAVERVVADLKKQSRPTAAGTRSPRSGSSAPTATPRSAT